MEVRLTVSRLQHALNDLVNFAEGTLGNSIKVDDKSKINYQIWQTTYLLYYFRSYFKIETTR